jgi:isopentenyl-diphosphate delta-isomerase
MRAMIEHPSLTETYFVRDKAPNCFIAGNIGAAQIMQYKPEDVEAALLAVEANALAIHVNAAQEAMQPEGDTDFFGVSERIAEYADKIKLPVYVKEVGHGISFETAFLLKDTKIKAIDVEGAGGTSWTRVDALRHKESFGEDFRDYGLPTAISLIETKNALRGTGKKIIASGGIRSGLDIAKSLCLGADMSGMALPVLKAQQKKGANGVREYLEKIITETRISLFLSGAKNISEMQKQHYAVTGRLKEWLKQ